MRRLQRKCREERPMACLCVREDSFDAIRRDWPQWPFPQLRWWPSGESTSRFRWTVKFRARHGTTECLAGRSRKRGHPCGCRSASARSAHGPSRTGNAAEDKGCGWCCSRNRGSTTQGKSRSATGLRRSRFSEHGGDRCSTECGTRSHEIAILRSSSEGSGASCSEGETPSRQPARCRRYAEGSTVTRWHSSGPRG